MGDFGVVFYRIDSGRMSAERAGDVLKNIARLTNGTSGDGSIAEYNFRAGIRRGEGGAYWVGFNSAYWGYLFELALARYDVPVRRSNALPDGSQPVLRPVTSRYDVGRTLAAPLTDYEEKANTVDEALDMLSHAARGAWRRRRRRR